MSKERLEEIKEHTAWTVDNWLQPRIDDYDIAWLINRVEELEKQSHSIELNLLNDEVVRLEKKNQIYKQALELVEDELEYAKTTGNDEVRDIYIKNSIRVINEVLEAE